jgi:hypothetical protein
MSKKTKSRRVAAHRQPENRAVANGATPRPEGINGSGDHGGPELPEASPRADDALQGKLRSMEAAPTPAQPAAARAADPKPAAAERAAARPTTARPTAARPAKPAASRAGRGHPPVVIHQIFFDGKQRPHLESPFTPFDNGGSRDPLLEFGVFEKLYAGLGKNPPPLWGAVSWRFREKTGLTGSDFLQAIAERPGCDLYLCSPNPELEAIYSNLWMQGAPSHPRLLEVAAAFLQVNGIGEDCLYEIQPSVVFSNANYFVGGPGFWDQYVPFVRRLIDTARKSLPRPMLKLINSSEGDPRKLHAEATYWPFIIERLLPVFLKQHGQGLRVARIPPINESRLNSHLRRLREMKDVAHHTKSKWLASCWLHYRNTYVMNIASRDWCQTNLPLITPKSLEFY